MFTLEKYSSGVELKNVFIFYYYQKTLKCDIINRPISSVALFLSGSATYSFCGKEITVKGGDAIYFPKGSTYSYSIDREKPYIMQVEFNLMETTEIGEKDILFSSQPIILHGLANQLKPLFDDLAEYKYIDRFRCVLTTFRLIDICQNAIKADILDKDLDKILPAVRYIEQNVTNHISLEELAKLSCISQTHLRRLFKKCFGMSPIKYKNSILANIAKEMLVNEGYNVSETADKLKFPDIYTFSQFFKKEIGVSPRSLLKEKNGR